MLTSRAAFGQSQIPVEPGTSWGLTALPKKRCLELSQPNKRWNLERLKVPDTFFWAKPGLMERSWTSACHTVRLHRGHGCSAQRMPQRGLFAIHDSRSEAPMRSSIACLAGVLVLICAAAYGAEDKQEKDQEDNLLVNGSFEEGPEPGDQGWKPLDKGSKEIMGWEVTRG